MSHRLAALARTGSLLRRAALAAVAGALLAASPARTQHPGSDTGGAPDVPPGPASIRGRVLEPAGAGAADVEVVLYALPQGQAPGVRRGTTDADGRFVFQGIANDPSTAYLLGARRGEIAFPGERVSFGEGELDREVTIQLADASPDVRGVSVEESRLRVDGVGGRIVVTESHRLRNPSTQVVFVPEAERASRAAAFRTTLPPDTDGLTGPLGVLPEGLVRTGDELAFFGPLYPGEQELTFTYLLPSKEGSTSVLRRLASGAASVTLLAPESGPVVEAEGLAPGTPVSLGGRSYRALVGGRVLPGGRVAFNVSLPPAQADPSALSVSEVRAFVEQDGAAVIVRENHRLSVAGDRMLVAPAEGGLYRIAVPDGASDIRFATDPPGIVLAPAEDGGIEVAGPVPAGESTIELLYHVPVSDGASEVVLQSSRGVPLLSIFVADTGLELASDRLHRRRPVRTEDRTYLHLEAFDVEPNERVALRMETLSRGSASAGTVAAIVAALGVAAIAALLAAPLRRSPGTAAPEAAAPAESREREALYAAMQDLEEDFETGKLSEEDHALLRDELRARALGLLREEEVASSRSAGAEAPATRADSVAAQVGVASAPACTDCGAALRPGDRFCARCGSRVDAAPREASA